MKPTVIRNEGVLMQETDKKCATSVLQLKRIDIVPHAESIAYLSRNCDQFRPEEFQALGKVEISHNGNFRYLSTLAIVDDTCIVGDHQLGLDKHTFERLGLPEGSAVTIAPAQTPASLDYLRAKIHGHTLPPSQIEAIIGDISQHRYSKMEIAAFLVACTGFMTTEEMLSLTTAMTDAGTKIFWPQDNVVDKHCIGGIPGNRTSMIVVPIVAAHGLLIPKTSSRAITSPAGTADTMEVLAKVDLDEQKMKSVVNKCNGCIVWGGHVNLSPADDILISVERPLNIDTWEQMVASIMSKKLAAGSKSLLIDIPHGPSSKVHSYRDALRLRKLFEYVGDQLGLQIEVMITAAAEPIGRGIGPVLEARDVMQVLRNDPEAPPDLREKSLKLAGRLLEFDPQLRGGTGYERAEHILSSGQALTSMESIINAQGRNNTPVQPGPLTKVVLAPLSGTLSSIDCYRLARIARLAGAPTDKGAGIDLFKKTGEIVKKGEALYRIHSCNPADFRYASEMADEDAGLQFE